MLRLIKRHLKACAKNSETDFRCEPKVAEGSQKCVSKALPKPRCPFYITGPHPLKRGEVFKESTETSDQRIAQAKLLKRETEFLLEPDRVTPKAAKTLVEAVDAFLGTKKSTSKARQRKFKRLLYRQSTYLKEKYGLNPIITQIEKSDLDEFVDSWTGALSTLKRDRENVKQFWLYCATKDFTPKNLAAGLQGVGTKRDDEEAKNKPIPTFHPDEVAVFDQALDRSHEIFRRENHQDPEASMKTRAFMYVMKFSGLAIVDVVTLKPTDLGSSRSDSCPVPLSKVRWKTGKIAHTAIPFFVWEMLQAFKPESDYFFWSGKNDEPESRVDTFRDRMKKVFVAAKVRIFQKTARKKSGGKLKREPETFLQSSAIPHMWRHTLVRDLYVQRKTVREIADILGDDPATVTEYYSQFDGLRQEQAMETLGELYSSDATFQRHSASSDDKVEEVLTKP